MLLLLLCSLSHCCIPFFLKLCFCLRQLAFDIEVTILVVAVVLLSAVIALLGLAVLVTYSPQNGISLWAIAFLISPLGLPQLAFWLLGKVQNLKFAIQDLVYG